MLNDDDAFNDDSGLEILQTDLPNVKITENEAHDSDELTTCTGQQPTDTREERNVQISSSHTPPQCGRIGEASGEADESSPESTPRHVTSDQETDDDPDSDREEHEGHKKDGQKKKYAPSAEILEERLVCDQPRTEPQTFFPTLHGSQRRS